MTSSRGRSPSILVPVAASGSRTFASSFRCRFLPAKANVYVNRLAWMEMRLILAKLLYKFDIDLVDKNLDWYGESFMEMTWNRPPLRAKMSLRGVNAIPVI